MPRPPEKTAPVAGQGLWADYRTHDGVRVKETAANMARATGQAVGACRQCGGVLHVGPSLPEALCRHCGEEPLKHGDESVAPVTLAGRWLEFHCRACGHVVASPDGKRLEQSSRKSEQPQGWERKRVGVLKAEKSGIPTMMKETSTVDGD